MILMKAHATVLITYIVRYGCKKLKYKRTEEDFRHAQTILTKNEREKKGKAKKN